MLKKSKSNWPPISNLKNHWNSSTQAINTLTLCHLVLCFWVLMFVFSIQYFSIQDIIPYFTPLLLAFLIGRISRINPEALVFLFYLTSLIGLQTVLYIIHNYVHDQYKQANEVSSPNASFGTMYYMFGFLHMIIINSIGNLLFKLIYFISIYQSSIVIINSLSISPLSCVYSQIFFLSLLVLFFYYENQKNSALSYFLSAFYRLRETYKRSIDTIIINSNKDKEYRILFCENPLNKYFKQDILQSPLAPKIGRSQTSTLDLQNIPITSAQIYGKNKLGKNEWQEIDIKNHSLDILIKFLYSKNDIWHQDDPEKKESMSLKKARFQNKQNNIINQILIKKKDRLICKFVVSQEQMNITSNQVDQSNILNFEGKIFVNQNPYTNDRYLKIFISKRQVEDYQETFHPDDKKRQLKLDSLQTIQIKVSEINDILNIPLRQSINEILAKISMLQNKSKGQIVRQASQGYSIEHSTKMQKNIRMQASHSSKTLPSSVSQVKIDHNITILYQNILYLQSMIQYQHSYIMTQLIREEYTVKIQKFSLEDFLDEFKGIITTQFYSYLLCFNIDDQSNIKQQNQPPAHYSIFSQRKNTINSDSRAYMYTDLSILRIILILICEKVVKANNFEKQQNLSLKIQNEGENSISFTLKFPEIQRKLFINSFLEQSLEQLGSSGTFLQSMFNENQESIILISNKIITNPNSNTIEFTSPRAPNQLQKEDKYCLKEELNNSFEKDNGKINQIKFIILQDLSQKMKNLDALILDKLRENEKPLSQQFNESHPNGVNENSKQDTIMFSEIDQIRPRKQSKYKEFKLEYMVESLNFDQFESSNTNSGTTEPFENYETETYIQIKKPSIFQKSIKKSPSISVDSYQNSQFKQMVNKSQKEINSTRTVFIVQEMLQQKEEIEEVLQEKFKGYANIYEFKSLYDCIEKMDSEAIEPDILILDARTFLSISTDKLGPQLQFILTNRKETLIFYIFNEDEAEHEELQTIFYKPQFRVVKYEEIQQLFNE